MIGRIIIGLIVIVIGYFMVWRPDWALSIFGDLAISRYFSGGGLTLFKLIGVLLIFIGAIVMANLQVELFNATLGWPRQQQRRRAPFWGWR